MKSNQIYMLRAYKYRIYPNKEQEKMFFQHFGACRFIYNWGLENKIRTYETDGKSISRFALQKMLPDLKSEHDWIKDVNSQSIQSALLNLENAFTRFFREKKGFPKFKSRKNPVQSFSVPQHYIVNFDTHKIKLPKIGWVKAKLHRKYEGAEKTATVSVTSTGKFFISILIDDGQEQLPVQHFDADTTVGIDVGIKDFAILSNGEKIENPRYLKQSLLRLKVLQKRLSRKQKGSNNRNKAKNAVAKIHEKIHNQRSDFQHKLSFRLVCENQAIALETLNVEGMLKNHKLAQHIADASWSSFVTQLEYKAQKHGKTILRIGQFEPSTKICSECGYYNRDLTLSDRDWICPDCGVHHDRDINAAINIRKFAFDKQNLIGI
ncbi:IS200/IS605 family element RNA-guided endonuclease TnpB [Methanoplanus endosymbiosus]|uniref:IS200/IS605 family element RNA-guided endonuclease TnpB n=1 Tax=Methanoplanus endosymbiosus TaxID=33865 RepID=A0A9E7PR73_9EURY|nr:IS200/IS605 family element RNA-guided endonuclease TnpB [Methanoplanus endosymbiosus]UUX93441.1 IS200/IS605 family element RNA-guided endonuclease TnpB [Methanoplanus endosymbiosus]